MVQLSHWYMTTAKTIALTIGTFIVKVMSLLFNTVSRYVNGNPLQCSCLENPRDWGAWWAAISGVTQSWTRLKRLSSKKDIGTSWNKAGLLNYKAINKNMRYSQVIMWKKKNDICILLVEFSEIMILRTKDRNLRERWHSKAGDPHYMETWDDSTYFRIHYYLSANLHND